MRLAARLPLVLALVVVIALSAWTAWGLLTPHRGGGEVAAAPAAAAAENQAPAANLGEIRLCNALTTAPGGDAPPLQPGPAQIDCFPCWAQCGGSKCTLDCYPCICDPRCPD